MMLGHDKLFTVIRFLGLREAPLDRPLKLSEHLSSNLRWYQWFYPTIATAIATWSVWYFGLFSIFEGPDNILKRVNSLLSMLIGFYIASLAAVATFQSPRLEEEIVGRKILHRKTSLRRRQFLCAIFGYCSGLTILIFLGTSLSELLRDDIKAIGWVTTYPLFFKLVGAVLYFWACFSLMSSTLLGLNYLVDRMHR